MRVNELSRRSAHLLALATVQQLLPPRAGLAARGAAELDAEFYLRGLLGQPSLPQLKLALPKDRELEATAACALLEATRGALGTAFDCSAAEVAARAAARRPTLAIEYERAVLAGAFGPSYDYDASTASGVRLALGTGAVACNGAGVIGMYDFELSVYALFTLLGEARLPPDRLAAWYALLGERLLAVQLSPSAPPPRPATAASLQQVEAGLRALLMALTQAGYLTGFAIDNSDADEKLWAQKSELSVTRYTLTLSNPASLRAATQLNAATGGRVTAGLAVPMLLAFLRASGVSVLQSSEYFLDDDYKPNPIAYNPSSLIVELELSPVPRSTRPG